MALRILLLTCICLITAAVFSQQCTGNLGENIFTEGDFGSGADNVLLTDPGIAPGYIYQPNPPPQDGFYTITNNTASWAGLFTTWDGFSDNSSDPNGYFMVVNANFSPGKFYEQEVDNLCENTVYQFTADVRNMIRSGVNQLLPDISFSIDGDVQFTTGPIGETETWNTYGFTFTTEPGQTSVLLALNNNAPGGNGNDLALDNITFRVCGPSASIAIVGGTNECTNSEPITLSAEISGNQFSSPAIQWQESTDGGLTWQDIPGATAMTYEHNGQMGSAYSYRYLLAGSPGNLANRNCRVISDTEIINVAPAPVTVVDTICAGSVYSIGTNQFTTTGETTVTIPSSLGCDSVVTLRLTVLDDPILEAFGPDIVCLSDNAATLRAQLSNDTQGTFVWTDATGEFLGEGIEIIVNPLVQSMYTVTFTEGAGGCGTSVTTEVTVDVFDDEIPGLSIVATNDLGDVLPTTVFAGNRVTLTLEGIPNGLDVDVQWSGNYNPGTGSGTSITVDVPVEGGADLAYTARVTVAGTDCSVSVPINLSYERGEAKFPDVITPNGDGTNDFFKLFASPGAVTDYTLLIFNRWGQKVFESTDPLENWDGTKNGTPQNMDTYVYVAKYRLNGTEIEEDGQFSLIR